MRTVVVSDLHLGNRKGADVLRLGVVQDRLLDALAGAQRLVLLGDTLQLMDRQARRSMEVAEPVLRRLGQRMGSRGEVVVVPGNHDAPLVRGWARAQGRDLQPSATVPPAASPALSRLVSWLSPARVSVHYPGLWLSDSVWATHGHYLDDHLVPRSAVGLLRPVPGHPLRSRLPIDYERTGAGRRRQGEHGGTLKRAGRSLRGSALTRAPRLLLRADLSPVVSTVLDTQMRRAAVPAMARVARELGISARWVVFGHVHRRGQAGEDWPAADEVRLLNTGCWLHEPLLTNGSTPPHPYWPGGAVILDDGSPPRVVTLLDDLPDLGAIRSRARNAVGR